MLPKANTPERNAELVDGARAGDRAAIHALILGHVRYVTALAMRLCFVPQFTDEAISIAYVELCKAVSHIQNGRMEGHDNVTAYVRMWVKGRVLREIRKYVRGRGEKLQDVCSAERPDMEDREEIDALAITAMDRRIIRLSAEGYTTEEIAKKVNRSLSYVANAKAELLARYKERAWPVCYANVPPPLTVAEWARKMVEAYYQTKRQRNARRAS